MNKARFKIGDTVCVTWYDNDNIITHSEYRVVAIKKTNNQYRYILSDGFEYSSSSLFATEEDAINDYIEQKRFIKKHYGYKF